MYVVCFFKERKTNMHIFSENNKDKDANQLKKQQPEREARRQQQADLDEQLRLLRQRKQAFRRKQEHARTHIRSFFIKLGTK
jgi:hypothetical protein